MTSSREKSIVRFEAHVKYIDRKCPTRTTTKLLDTRTSSLYGNNRLGQTHKYIPRLHRQTTEIPSATPLGSTLQQFAQTCLADEFSFSKKSAALEELKSIVNKVIPSLSRNIIGLQFLPCVYALGFSHWQTQPERRVVCYLPIRLPKVQVHPKSCDKVLLQLPRKFPSGMNIEPSVLESSHPGCKFLSSKKLYSLVLKMLRRILLMKSVHPDKLNFSSSCRTLEITLQENDEWIGDIIPCVVTGSSGNVMYCCKPFGEDITISSHQADSDDSKNKDQSLMHLEEEGDIHDHISTVNGATPTVSISLNSLHLNNNLLSNSIQDGATTRGSASPESTNTSRDENPTHSIPTEPATVSEDLSEIYWYPCNPQSENNVLDTISKTDGGLRMTATMIMCKLAQRDWRLLSLRCYEIQTAMLHDVEHRLDHSPRWQRDTLERCIHSLLSILHKFFKRSCSLPHFSVGGVNLWSSWSQKQLSLAESALGRLSSSETALVSLVCRTGNISFENMP